MQPFIFMVTFWGPAYRQYFVDRCFASLLAPGNFPQLRAEDGHRLLIATTLEDWQAIEQLPIMRTIRGYVAPVHLEIEPPPATAPGSESAILQQNRCHKLLLEAAYSYRAYGCMLWPDIIFSDGLCVALRRWAAAGHELVLFASLRHAQEPVLDELSARGLLPRDGQPSLTCRPLVLPPRVLADISVRHLHPEVSAYEFEDPRFPVAPAHVYARIPGNRGIVLHTFHGQQILMDFAAIETHHTDCLSQGLFEDVYLDENFAECRKIHVVRDSDEFGILSLTPTAVGSISKRKNPKRSKRGQSLALSWRLRAGMLHHTQQNRYRIRRDLFRVPILWHGDEIDGAWTEKQAQLDRLIEQATADFYGPATEPPGASLRLSVKFRRRLGDLLYWVYVRPRHFRVIVQAAWGDRDAWRIIGRAVRRVVEAS
ncbi:MAG: hypothetical protein ABSE22_08195 [Xanthobacteraceae bacterium]|jgi:hypothetical protein